jgi:hypothetical protein
MKCARGRFGQFIREDYVQYCHRIGAFLYHGPRHILEWSIRVYSRRFAGPMVYGLLESLTSLLLRSDTDWW